MDNLENYNALVRQAIFEVTGHQCRHDHKEVIGFPFDFVADEKGYVSGGVIRNVEYVPREFLRFWTDTLYYEWRQDQSSEKSVWSRCTVITPLHLGRAGTFHLASLTHFTR